MAFGEAGGEVKIIAVVGTGSGCGKTTVASRILAAIPGLGAVKISPRPGPSRVEWGAGAPGKDTALYVESGAAPVARIIGPRGEVGVSWDLIKDRFRECRGVVIEGTSALDLPGNRFVVFVVGGSFDKARESRNREIGVKASIIYRRSSHCGIEFLIMGVRAFVEDPKIR